MCLKRYGQIVHEYECTASSRKKGVTKLSLGIMRQMYGEDKKWKELMSEMANAITEARDKRGAGEKPVMVKYDPNFIVMQESREQECYEDLFRDDMDTEEEKRIEK